VDVIRWDRAVCVAVVLDGFAYKKRSEGKVAASGVVLAAVGGILMGLFYPLIVKGTTGRSASGAVLSRAYVCSGRGAQQFPD